MISYETPGVSKVYGYEAFFTKNSIAGCLLDCNYGDSCGASTTLPISYKVSVTNPLDPWEITAPSDEIFGYSDSLCLRCTSNNLYTIPDFTFSFTI